MAPSANCVSQAHSVGTFRQLREPGAFRGVQVFDTTIPAQRTTPFRQRHQMMMHRIRKPQPILSTNWAMREASLRQRQPIPRNAIHGVKRHPIKRCVR